MIKSGQCIITLPCLGHLMTLSLICQLVCLYTIEEKGYCCCIFGTDIATLLTIPVIYVAYNNGDSLAQ